MPVIFSDQRLARAQKAAEHKIVSIDFTQQKIVIQIKIRKSIKG